MLLVFFLYARKKALHLSELLRLVYRYQLQTLCLGDAVRVSVVAAVEPGVWVVVGPETLRIFQLRQFLQWLVENLDGQVVALEGFVLLLFQYVSVVIFHRGVHRVRSYASDRALGSLRDCGFMARRVSKLACRGIVPAQDLRYAVPAALSRYSQPPGS